VARHRVSSPEQIAADLALVGLEQAEAAGRADWDAVERFDRVRRDLLDRLAAHAPRDLAPVRVALASAAGSARQVEQRFRLAQAAASADARRTRLGSRAGRAYGAAAEG
jgi:hypothetical protein